jgi:hypothetical protein
MTQARTARPTIQFVDEYCQEYADLFPEVRSFESFKCAIGSTICA